MKSLSRRMNSVKKLNEPVAVIKTATSDTQRAFVSTAARTFQRKGALISQLSQSVIGRQSSGSSSGSLQGIQENTPNATAESWLRTEASLESRGEIAGAAASERAAKWAANRIHAVSNARYVKDLLRDPCDRLNGSAQGHRRLLVPPLSPRAPVNASAQRKTGEALEAAEGGVVPRPAEGS